MFVSPSKIRKDKILKGRTLSFETVKKTHGNMVIIPTTDKKTLQDTIKSNLFRPMQLLSLYTPRKVKPRGRQVVIINQKDYYSEFRVATDGRIKRGKTMLAAYNGQNLVYDIYNDYNINVDALSKIRHKQALQEDVIHYFENLIFTATSDPDYENGYLIFPMEKPFLDSQKIFLMSSDRDTIDPLALFIASINRGIIDLTKYEKIKLVVFCIPTSNILVAIDLKDPDFAKKWPSTIQKIKRLNNFNLGTDTLDDEDVVKEDDDSDLDPEDKLENKKEDIKKVVLDTVAKSIHANNLTDYEVASRDERDIMTSIDKKVDDYLAKPDNLVKPLTSMVSDIEKDNTVKEKAIKYIETKKAATIRADTQAKEIEKETGIISSLQDIDVDSSDADPDIFKVKEKNIDPRIEQSHLSSMDEEYNKKQAMKDLTNVVSSFSNSSYVPLTVDSFNLIDNSDRRDEKSTLNVRYKTDDNKPLSFQIDVPKIIDKRYLYLGGNKKFIKKQLIRLPIVKTKPDRVEITTNYNKMTIERTSGKLSRKNSYILKKLKEMNANPGFTITYGDNSIINSKLGYSNDFEYEELASSINEIKSDKYDIIFNRDDIRDEIDLLPLKDENFITPTRTPLGLEKIGENVTGLIYIENRVIYKLDISKNFVTKVSDSMFEFLTNDVLKLDMSSLPAIGKSFVYTNVTFLASTYPLLAIVASQNGLTDILKRYNVDYYFSDKPQKLNSTYIGVKFKDKYLYYKDEIRNTLLLDALYLFNTDDYNYTDFDADIPYTHYFMKSLGDSVGIHTRNTLRLNLGVYIDPITRDILRDLKQPTDIIDVLLYANTLLVGNQYKPQNDLTNYRVRSNEIVSDVLYKTIAESYLNYQKHKINGRPINLVVPKGELIKKLLAQPNVNDKSTLNPIKEAEEIADASAKGFNGVNLNSAFTLEMRAYDESMNGFVSGNSTPYSGQAGITRALSYDPKITSVRGYIPYVDSNTLSAANILSPTELLSSFTAAGADSPRQAMQVAQTGHTLPVLHSSKQLIGSGMNKTLAYMISDDFCFKAKENGIVEKIDNKNQLAFLLYDNGTKDAIDLGDQLDKNSNMGFYIHQNFLIVYSEGERFEKGDVIAYNPSYFSGKGKDVDYHPGVLAKVAIASGDFAFEDSTLISESLCDKCAAKINMLKQVVLGKNAEVFKIVNVGDKVLTGDHLVEFTSSYSDPDTAEFLRKLNQTLDQDQLDELTHESVDSKFSGTVTSVDFAYNCPFEELSPSLQSFIKRYKSRLQSRADALKDIHTGSVHVPELTQTTNKRFFKEEFPDDGGVIINIYVEYIDKLGMGDKITYSTALKGVVSRVLSKDEAPLTDYRPDETIEAILTPTGIISRMTSDIYSMVFGNKVLVELGKQIREIWNDER